MTKTVDERRKEALVIANNIIKYYKEGKYVGYSPLAVTMLKNYMTDENGPVVPELLTNEIFKNALSRAEGNTGGGKKRKSKKSRKSRKHRKSKKYRKFRKYSKKR